MTYPEICFTVSPFNQSKTELRRNIYVYFNQGFGVVIPTIAGREKTRAVWRETDPKPIFWLATKILSLAVSVRPRQSKVSGLTPTWKSKPADLQPWSEGESAPGKLNKAILLCQLFTSRAAAWSKDGSRSWGGLFTPIFPFLTFWKCFDAQLSQVILY